MKNLKFNLFLVFSFILGGLVMTQSSNAQEEKKYKEIEVKYLYADSYMPGRAYSVYDVTVDKQGNIYLPSFRRNEVLVLDKDYNQIDVISGMEAPHGVHVDKDGNLYIGTYRNGVLMKYNSKRERVTSWDDAMNRQGLIGQVASITSDNEGNVYVGDYKTNGLYKFSPEGELLVKFEVPPQSPTYEPHGIGCDGENHVYLAERGKRVVQKYTLDGKFVEEWSFGDFDPLVIRFIEKNHMVVPNYKEGTITVIDTNGKIVTKIGELGGGPGQFSFATNMEFDGKGHMFVVEQDGNRLHKFDVSELIEELSQREL